MIEIDTSVQLEYTLGIFKPDVQDRVGELMQATTDAGFRILASSTLKMSEHQAAQFYREHYGKPFYDGLIAFMTSGPSTVVALSKPQAVSEWRTFLTTVLRPKFGTNATQNAVHGSDSAAAAKREINFFFPNLVVPAFPGEAPLEKYVQQAVGPVLTKALAELARVQPADPCRWLGTWLLENNPNKPKQEP
eukprot:ANDGO_00988.mRNA.1 Nucleoside diphosphate kinase